MQPLVTVITPVYNCEKYIKQTIESVLSQDYKNIEYVVINDGSTDNSLNIAREYLSDKRLTVLTHENIGEHKTINRGLGLVQGKYFMYPNADDPLLPGAISNLVECMEQNPEILCVYPDWDVINEDGSLKTKITTRDYDFTYMVRHHTCLPSVGTIFRSSIIDIVGYRDPEFIWISDFDYWLRIGLNGDMKRLPLTLANWRHRLGQGTQVRNSLKAQQHIQLMTKFYSLPNIPNKIKDVYNEARCWSYLVAASVTDSKTETIKYIMTALSYCPQILGKLEFYDALARRALYILRR